MTTKAAAEDSNPTEPINRGELPDPFVRPGGNRIAKQEEWPACARAWRDMVVEREYGGLPPAPDGVEAETSPGLRPGAVPGRPQTPITIPARTSRQPGGFSL